MQPNTAGESSIMPTVENEYQVHDPRSVLAGALRAAIAVIALATGINSVAWSGQMPVFHPLGPTRPAIAPPKTLRAPATGRPANGLAKSKTKMTPEQRKKLIEAMQHQKRKAPAQKR
jgi:hypothetical protein